MARYSLIPWGLSDIVILVTITTEMIDDVSDNDDDDDGDDGSGGDDGDNDDDGDAANGDKPEVSPKECIDRQAGTFAQDIPASHVYCRLETRRKYSVL